MDQFSICLGDDAMALYRNGNLVTAAVRLTFADVLEGCGISCDLWEVDLDIYDTPEKFPKTFKELDMEISEQVH